MRNSNGSRFVVRESVQRPSFRERVHAIVRAVPKGRVVTYGQVAVLAGRPRGAREVGWIAHAGGAGIPWQRVVNRHGGLARGYSGGVAGHKRALAKDGVRVSSRHRVDLQRYLWWPSGRALRRLDVAFDSFIALRRFSAFPSARIQGGFPR